MYPVTSEIFIIGINPYIPVPDAILQKLFQDAGKERGSIPVVITIDGKLFKQTLVRYQGMWRLYLNGPMREHANREVGDTIHLSISFDSKPRMETIPKQFTISLEENLRAEEIYESLAPYRKKEILRYLNSMKTEESLKRNIVKIIQHLLGEKPKGLYALMRRKESK